MNKLRSRNVEKSLFAISLNYRLKIKYKLIMILIFFKHLVHLDEIVF